MGVCCSTTAKETGASSSRHLVSVSSSPNLFPTENEYGQDSELASHVEETRSRIEKTVETASVVDLTEKRSTSGFIETGVDPTLEAKHCPREKRDSLENLLHRPHGNKEWSEESSTENGDGDSVIALKSCPSGAIRRLKKEDSIRQLNYKDEIMLTDNTDSFVEREIPEVPDEIISLAEDIDYILNDDLPATESIEINLIGSNGLKSPRSSATPPSSAKTNKKKAENSLAEDVNYILNDDLPAAESSGINLIGSDGLNSPSSSVTPRSSVKTIEGKADKSLAEDIDYILNDDMPPAECSGQRSPSSDVIPRSSAKRNKAKKEAKDNKLESDIQNIVSERKPDAKSNGTSLSIAGAAPGPKAIYAKRKKKKIDDKEQVLEEVLRSYFKQ